MFARHGHGRLSTAADPANWPNGGIIATHVLPLPRGALLITRSKEALRRPRMESTEPRPVQLRPQRVPHLKEARYCGTRAKFVPVMVPLVSTRT
jgi:hypothetical protein